MTLYARFAVRILSVAAVGAAMLAGCGAPTPKIDRKVPQEGALQHYQRARLAFEQNRVPDAMSEIERALKMDPKLPQVWFYRGYMYFTLGDFAKAEADFRTAIERHPFYTDARMYLAACLDQQGKPDAALVELDRALADTTYPTPEQVRLNKALILERVGRRDEALTELRRAVGARPKYYRAHFEMGRLLAAMDRFDEAELAFEAAEAGEGKNPEYQLARAETLLKIGQTNDARARLRRVLELAPGSEAAAKAAALLKEAR